MGAHMAPTTIPVDDLPGLREFAREWAGQDLWDGPFGMGWGDWCERISISPEKYRDVLPLHVAAGFDLGVRYLARRPSERMNAAAVANIALKQPGLAAKFLKESLLVTIVMA